VNAVTLRDIADQFQRWVKTGREAQHPDRGRAEGRRDEFIDPYFVRAKRLTQS